VEQRLSVSAAARLGLYDQRQLALVEHSQSPLDARSQRLLARAAEPLRAA
jgi:hypothetical protein